MLMRSIALCIAITFACTASIADAFGQTPSATNEKPSVSRDELLAQERRPEINSLGTTAMMLYVMVNCRELDEQDAAILINAELRKLKGIDPRVQLKTVASAKLQAEAKTTRQICARLDQQDVFKIKQAVREEKLRAEPSAQTGQPHIKQNSYENVYTDEVRRQRLDELGNEIRTLYFAIGCGVINEDQAAWGLLSTKSALIWPQPGDPLFNLKQPNQYVSGQALFFGIPPEIVDAAYMAARRAGLSAAGADPDARVVREFRTGVPSPPMAIPLYSGPVGTNCAHWREHPEDVVQVHHLANYLNLRATSGQIGYR